MLLNRYVLLFSLVFASVHASWGQEMTALEIVTKADQVMKGVNSTYTEMTVTTVRPKWTRDMTLKSWSMGDDLSMMFITSPAKDKGTAYLMNDKEVWNWVPSINRTIKMPPSMMMQSWMGTDLTNDDLVQQSSLITDYEHKLLGEDSHDGRACYKVELKPKADAAVVWGKIVMWVDQQDFFQLKVEFYDEDEDLVNLMTSSNIQVMDGKKLPTRMEVIPMDKSDQKTVIEYTSMEFDIDIDESFFLYSNNLKD